MPAVLVYGASSMVMLRVHSPAQHPLLSDKMIMTVAKLDSISAMLGGESCVAVYVRYRFTGYTDYWGLLGTWFESSEWCFVLSKSDVVAGLS